MAPENRPQMESSLPMLVSGRVYNKYQYTGHSEMISLWMVFDVEDVRFFMSQVILPTNQQVTPFDGWNFLEKRNRNCWPHDMEIKLAIFTSPQNYVNIQRQYGHFWRVFLDRRGISLKNDQTSWWPQNFPWQATLIEDVGDVESCASTSSTELWREPLESGWVIRDESLKRNQIIRVQQGRSTWKIPLEISVTESSTLAFVLYRASPPKIPWWEGFSWGFDPAPGKDALFKKEFLLSKQGLVKSAHTFLDYLKSWNVWFLRIFN